MKYFSGVPRMGRVSPAIKAAGMVPRKKVGLGKSASKPTEAWTTELPPPVNHSRICHDGCINRGPVLARTCRQPTPFRRSFFQRNTQPRIYEAHKSAVITVPTHRARISVDPSIRAVLISWYRPCWSSNRQRLSFAEFPGCMCFNEHKTSLMVHAIRESSVGSLSALSRSITWYCVFLRPKRGQRVLESMMMV